MNTARIVVLTVAVGAGGIAPCLASGFDNKPPQAASTSQFPTLDVLVAKSDIGPGLPNVDLDSSDHKSSKRGDSVNVVRDGISTAMTTVKWPKGRNI
jgi:Flp pilus assembly protein CpaB